MFDDTPIKASWFYLNDCEKVKINWFLYEFACMLYLGLKRSTGGYINKWKSKRSNKQLAEFCAYLSKRMKQDIFKRLDGFTSGVMAYEDHIFEYCHTNTPEENRAVFEVVESVWKEMLMICQLCPTGCLDEYAGRCYLFDEMA
jgi:hypothetical protein